MEKYYTPAIEEFHVGFEYEINMHFRMAEESKWYSAIITKDNWGANMDIINVLARARVKYLDREDIESLGWKYRSEEKHNVKENGGETIFTTFYGDSKSAFGLVISNKSRLVTIYQLPYHLDKKTIHLIIKNKSE